MIFARFHLIGLLALLFLSSGCARAAADAETFCQTRIVEGMPYTICRADQAARIRLYLDDESGQPLARFRTVAAQAQEDGEALIFAVNGGMYHADRSAVGLYIEKGQQSAPLNTNAGPGNFHMLPNGVFWISSEKNVAKAHVGTAETYTKLAKDNVRYATQSGPMLVIDGALHPRFKTDSDSRRVRNGVGLDAKGRLWFVTSDAPVNFHRFARVFRDHLATPNALYLDGTVSKVFAPELGRLDTGADMGPIIGYVGTAE